MKPLLAFGVCMFQLRRRIHLTACEILSLVNVPIDSTPLMNLDMKQNVFSCPMMND